MSTNSKVMKINIISGRRKYVHYLAGDAADKCANSSSNICYFKINQIHLILYNRNHVIFDISDKNI